MTENINPLISIEHLQIKTTSSLSWGGSPMSFQLEVLVLLFPLSSSCEVSSFTSHTSLG